MNEITETTIKKELHFEKGGETLSVSLSAKNVSPDINVDSYIQFFDTLYEKSKRALRSYLGPNSAKT